MFHSSKGGTAARRWEAVSQESKTTLERGRDGLWQNQRATFQISGFLYGDSRAAWLQVRLRFEGNTQADAVVASKWGGLEDYQSSIWLVSSPKIHAWSSCSSARHRVLPLPPAWGITLSNCPPLGDGSRSKRQSSPEPTQELSKSRV